MTIRPGILKPWIPAFLWMVLIFALSSIPGEDIPQVDILYIDKFTHLIEFTILGILLVRAFLNSHPHILVIKMIILSILIASLYGIIDELHQHFIPGRTFD